MYVRTHVHHVRLRGVAAALGLSKPCSGGLGHIVRWIASREDVMGKSKCGTQYKSGTANHTMNSTRDV
jgi:hypothetical protein